MDRDRALVSLQEKIERKEARLAVIGLGYVGLPVACQFAEIGFDVTGVELRAERVEAINSGISPIEGDEPGLSELLVSAVRSGRLRATTDYQNLVDRDVILIDVETPVDENNQPRYEALRSVLASLGPVMKSDTLVIVESTIAPGTMDGLVRPHLEKSTGKLLNQGFFLGNCPERVMPGKLLHNLRTLSRVVGGMTLATSQAMISLYRFIVQSDLDPADCITAELVKTTENAYRDVQIAFANEVALICDAVGGNVWRVRELVNKSPYRNMHLPGAGVGGHCIPKDPWLLAYSVHDQEVPLRLIPAARAVNDFMPEHMVRLLKITLESVQLSLSDSRILVMGYSYLEDSDDTRNSSSEKLVKILHDMGAKIVIHDPFVPGYQTDLLAVAEGCDAAIVMVRHSLYRDIDLDQLRSALRRPILVDGRHCFDPQEALDHGFIFTGIGSGHLWQTGEIQP